MPELMNITRQDFDEAVQRAVDKERERCMRLVIMRADISRASAKKTRDDGTYTAIAFGRPFFRRVKYVAFKWEQRARDFDHIARAFDVVAACIARGYDPATINDPSATVDLTPWRTMKIGTEEGAKR